MEIPGLNRITSPNQSTSVEPSPVEITDEAPEMKSIAPKIDPGLEARIAEMRAQIKLKESGSPDVHTPLENEAVSRPPPSVNFSILDKVLATHGLETMPDSDEEMAEGAEEVSSDSDTSSYVSSDEGDSDDEESVAGGNMTAEERERILIAADNDGPISNEVPRTKNEILEDEEPVRVPDFSISATEPIEALGIITSIVGKSCVVTGAPSPETRVLDVGSLLVFEDRRNLGFIADTFGPVILPMFSVRFNSVEELVSTGVQPGQNVFVVPKHAQYVFSDTLRVKGTDASNIHDEEQSETEFSDDEQEALHKSQKKQQRKAERHGTSQRETRPLNDLESIAMAQGLTYDPNNHQLRPMSEAQPGPSYTSSPGQHTNRGRGRGRGGLDSSRSGTRGRPETNNFGRGPQNSAASLDNRNQTSSSTTYQRAFYQSDSSATEPQVAGAQNVSSAPASTPSVPTLYQPLKRPT